MSRDAWIGRRKKGPSPVAAVLDPEQGLRKKRNNKSWDEGGIRTKESGVTTNRVGRVREGLGAQPGRSKAQRQLSHLSATHDGGMGCTVE